MSSYEKGQPMISQMDAHAHNIYDSAHPSLNDWSVSEAAYSVVDPVTVDAIEGNLVAFLLYSGRAPCADIRITSHYVSVQTGLPTPSMNAVIRASFEPYEQETEIAAALAPFKASQTPMVWWSFPSAYPGDLGPALAAHGLSYRGEGPGMAANLLALPDAVSAPAALTIEEVESEATLREWLHTTAAATGSDSDSTDPAYLAFERCRGWGRRLPYRRFLARLNGKPVGASALFLGAGVAGIYNVATIPEARGQGIGAAITLAPLRVARALGYRIGVLESSPLGYPVYLRLGFCEYCRIRSYLWMPEH